MAEKRKRGSAGKSSTGNGTAGKRRRSGTLGKKTASANGRTQNSAKTGRSRPVRELTPRQREQRRAAIKRRRRKQILKKRILPLAAVALILCLFLAGRSRLADSRTDASDTFYNGVYLNGISLGGLTMDQARQKMEDKLKQEINWQLKFTFDGNTYDLENILTHDLDAKLNEAYQVGRQGTDEEREAAVKDLKKNPVYIILDTSYSAEEASALIEQAVSGLGTEAVNADLIGYNKETKEYTFSEGTSGRQIDREDLTAQLIGVLEAGDYDAVLEAKVIDVQPEWTKERLQQEYRIIAEFETKTTANKDRNNNIQLASEAMNGTLLKPGEEFSMNELTGERSEEKGYKPAGTFVNGELVEEPGGGVCQVATTIYNAAILSGLNTTARRNHSYVVAYANVGEDAMVSYGSSDLKFENNSGHTVAVLIDFKDRNLKVSTYGIPVLEEGVTVKMESVISETGAMPEPVYEENPEVPQGQQVVVSEGKEPITALTDLVTYKDGQEIGREFLHTSRYKAKAPVIQVHSMADLTAPASEPGGDSGGETPDGGAGAEAPGNEGQNVPDEGQENQENQNNNAQ